MSSPSSAANGQPSPAWYTHLTPYIIPPTAAAGAIVLPFRDLIAKSALQKGQPIPAMSFLSCLKEGIKASPTVGVIVGGQMILAKKVERVIVGEKKKPTFSQILASSTIVGMVSAPILAVFNGQTMGWTALESLRKFTPRQALAITGQETLFVGGISAADKLAIIMKQYLGDNKAVEYTAAFTAGALGSLAGHPANTALTRWQSGLTVSPNQLMWGGLRKARAVGTFSVCYKVGKEVLTCCIDD